MTLGRENFTKYHEYFTIFKEKISRIRLKTTGEYGEFHRDLIEDSNQHENWTKKERKTLSLKGKIWEITKKIHHFREKKFTEFDLKS